MSTLKLPRFLALFLSFAWGIIGLGVVINGLVKSKQDIARIQREVRPVTVVIQTSDVSDSGTVIAVVSALIAVLSLIYILLIFVPKFGRKTLLFQSASLAFCAVWLLATQIAFTVFFATREANIQGFLGNIPLPSSLVQGVEATLGEDPAYKKRHYCKSFFFSTLYPALTGHTVELIAILPWFTFAFASIAAVVTFMAHSRDRKDEHA
ncbi:hypothetical protein C8J56DRAFT_795949 [Mycena floridula]|nr:hypothetical protein C8J56DRAFT_795949 [Mycena floridula]